MIVNKAGFDDMPVPPDRPRSGVREPFRKHNTVLLRTIFNAGCGILHIDGAAVALLCILQVSLQNLKPPVGRLRHSSSSQLLFRNCEIPAQRALVCCQSSRPKSRVAYESVFAILKLQFAQRCIQ